MLDRARATAAVLGAQQRQYAGSDRSIRPERFRVPDLQSQRVRAAAKAHGIDLDRWLATHT